MPDEQLIQVQGHAEVEATPDVAVVNLGVFTRESEAGAAMQAASRKMLAIIAAVQAQGVLARDIQTNQLNLYLDQPANVYQATHQLTVRTEDVSKAGAILDAAVGAGANASAGIQFALADDSDPEDRALELAVADARRKAETLATALAITIDGVRQVIVLGQGGPRHIAPAPSSRLGVRAAPSPIEAGQLRIGAEVEVTYSFH